MTRSTRAVDRRRRRSRSAVLDAARRLFAERGIADTGVAAIAAAAELAVGTLYSHFESKDALVAALIDDALRHRVPDADGDEGPAIERILALGGRAVDLALDDPVAARLLATALLASPPSDAFAASATAGLLDELHRSLRADVSELLPAGVSVEATVAVVAALWIGLAAQPLRTDGHGISGTVAADALALVNVTVRQLFDGLRRAAAEPGTSSVWPRNV